ncbi:MAG: TOBE domain-containing protein [Euryarchaeota archaeon]|nr:TOBE domain-containing protein [Euryarchaeota archaeon]MDE1837498.1 TOBE domain-containing protein [Euryarchaeota archaeon]MDE2045536.1 TOBE domain-containing protein [Thermoplasmata archaeon]
MGTRTVEREMLATPVDISLLRALEAEGNLVSACQSLGISRDRGTYRLSRLARLAGGPVVTAQRGGRTPGGTRLNSRGRKVLEGGVGPLGPVAHPGGPGAVRPLRGTWHARPEPHVDLSPSLSLVVGFRAREGERVGLRVDPESILVAKAEFSTSARNVLHGIVTSLRRGPGWETVLGVRVGSTVLSVAVTPSSVHRLRIHPGARLHLYVKATAVRRA